MGTKINSIEASKIAEAIRILTGLTPKETITSERYTLSLGIVNPLELGYDKNRKILSEETMSFSAHLKMLSVISEMMQDELNFLAWLLEQCDAH